MYTSFSPYFGLPDTFPSDQLLVRTYTGKKRNVYLASNLVKELTKRNESVLKVCYSACTLGSVELAHHCSKRNNMYMHCIHYIHVTRPPVPFLSAQDFMRMSRKQSTCCCKSTNVLLVVASPYESHFVQTYMRVIKTFLSDD